MPRRLPLASPITPDVLLQAAEKELSTILRDDGTVAERATEAIASARIWADQVVEDVEKRMPRSAASACDRGCAYCCHLKVLVTPPEALAIAAHLKSTRSDEELAAVRETVEEAAEALFGLTQQGRVMAQRPCALLVDGVCSVYPARPMHCWGANAYDAEACRHGYEHPAEESTVRTYAPQHQVADMLHASLSNASNRVGFDARVLELTKAVAVALTTPDIEARWGRGEPVFDAAVDAEFEAMIRGGPPPR